MLSFLFFSSGYVTEIQGLSSEYTLLYVPLDSRPVNTDVIEQMANITGINLISPPQELLGNLTTKGDTERLISWIEEESKNVDGFLLSADMLLYGGLISSRTNETSEKEAFERLTLLETIKKNYPDQPLFVYSSLLRLAPSVIHQHDLEEYENIRSWGILKGDEKNNAEKLKHLEKEISPSLLDAYIHTRHRNFSINRTLIEYANHGVIDGLLLGQDDASSSGIHEVEKQRLEENVKKEHLDNVFFLSGTDEMGSVLLSRFALEKSRITPAVYVVYDHPFAPYWTAPFDDRSVSKNIDDHLQANGMKRVYHPFLADMYFYVNTPLPNLYPIPTSRVAVADIALVNKSDTNFVRELLNTISLEQLYSYSGWNTAGNAVGLSLSFAGGRMVSLDSGKKEQTVAHASLLYRSFLLDNGYKSRLYPTLKETVEQAGDDPYSLGAKTSSYEKSLNQALQKENKVLFETYFKQQRLHINQNQTKFVTLEEAKLLPATFPWKRLFEIRLSPEIIAR